VQGVKCLPDQPLGLPRVALTAYDVEYKVGGPVYMVCRYPQLSFSLCRIMAIRSLVSVIGLAASVAANAIPRSTTLSFQDVIVAEAGGMHNVHVTYNAPLNGELSIHYGSCEAATSDVCDHTLGKTFVGSHPMAKRHELHPEQRPTKFVWLPPSDAVTGGCLHAFSGEVLVGRSTPVTVTSKKQKRWVAVSLPPSEVQPDIDIT
jgi:hypothetical protein